MKKADVVQVLSEVFDGMTIEPLDPDDPEEGYALMTIARPVGKLLSHPEAHVVLKWIKANHGKALPGFMVNQLLDLIPCHYCTEHYGGEESVAIVTHCEEHVPMMKEATLVPETAWDHVKRDWLPTFTRWFGWDIRSAAV